MRITSHSVFRSILAVVVAAFLVASQAGQQSANFHVNIRLNSLSPTSQAGVCISSVASEQTGAVVRVVCSTGQVVSIEAAPGTPVIAGVHGGAFRYVFGAGSLLAAGNGLIESELGLFGLGTVTALRIADVSRRERLEFLVSF